MIAGFMADYEEQTLINGARSGQHCTICTVPSDRRENLLTTWPIRTHEYMKSQVHVARNNLDDEVSVNDRMSVHDVPNFAWKHAHTNIQSAMMVDTLHQLLKRFG